MQSKSLQSSEALAFSKAFISLFSISYLPLHRYLMIIGYQI